MLSAAAIKEAEARRLGTEHRWVFILGLNNSGTTVLQQILSSHPEIHGLPGEGQFLTRALPNPTLEQRGRLFGCSPARYAADEHDRELDVLRVKYDWLQQYPDRPGHLLEKSPPNALRGRWLQHHFQPCSFVLLFRSPYPVCEGILRRRASGAPIEKAARHWATANRMLLDDLPQLGSAVQLRYEELCADPAGSLARVERLLKLRTPFRAESYSDTFKIKNLAGAPAALQNFNAQSIARLSPAAVHTINAIAGATMARLGYARLEPAPLRVSLDTDP